MVFEDVVSSRRSIRSFQDKEVPDTVIEQLLETALKVPSSSNTQPYRVAIVKGDTKAAIAKTLSGRFEIANKIQRMPLWKKVWYGLTTDVMPDGDFKVDTNYPAELKKRAVDCGMGLYSLLGIERSDYSARHEQMKRNFAFFDAPAAMYLFVHGDRGVYSALDAGMFLQNFMLAATANGLGSCAQAALATWAGPVKEHFNIDSDYKMICGLSFGYPDDELINTYQPEKRSVEELCFAER